ncbi:ALP1-like protein [Tanacetum coccineum]|uniref:ALP1-like protein n=1 Tax=Tanacetum coccineum TaxID=301880 RepID=A0ABQ5IJF0_9ASTR
MIHVKEMMEDNDLKNSKSKDKGSRSRSQSMNDQSHYKQDKTKTRQSINVKSHIFNVIGSTEEFEERDLNIGGDCANNDINVLDNSPLFDDLLDDKAPVAPYVVNGVGFADGIYQQWATFVKSFTVANDAKHAYFKKRQESARKDVERDFGVLQGRWGIIQQPARQYHVNTLRRIMHSCIIMHNMILEDQKMAVFD